MRRLPTGAAVRWRAPGEIRMIRSRMATLGPIESAYSNTTVGGLELFEFDLDGSWLAMVTPR